MSDGRTDDVALIIALLQDILSVLEEIRVDLGPQEEDEAEPDGVESADDGPDLLVNGRTWSRAEPRAWVIEGRRLASFIYVYDDNLPQMRH